MKQMSIFDFAKLRRHHIADQCVCCGSETLSSCPAILMPFVAHRTFGWAPVTIDESWGLHTVKRGVAYTVCRSLQCQTCGLLFSDIRFAEDELERLYKDYRGPEYTALREQYEPGYTQRNEALVNEINYNGILESFLEQHLPAGPLVILDWGGDSGKNTPLRSRALRHDVYDISNTMVIAGANSLRRDQLSEHHYDLIVCSNVLEHVPYPGDLIRNIMDIMTTQSLLYIEVPYEDLMRQHGDQALTHKKHWHEHINFFSLSSLCALMGNVGLRVISLQSDSSVTAGLKSASIIQMACRK
jgi:Methyltransferase domain